MIQLTNLNADKKYLLAVSGGLDSMVLLHMFTKSGYSFIVSHMNFKLRGSDSDKDQQLVESYCKKHNLEVYCKKVDVQTYKLQHLVSTQMAARELRYTWFNELMEENAIDFLVTAHHLDDVLEGFLLNLGRGSGLDGLLNLWNIDNPIRPLLPYSKAELYDFAIQHQIEWREDYSNKENTYQRNYLRNDVIPKLKQSNKEFLKRFSQSLTSLEDSYNLNKVIVNEFKSKRFSTEYPISVSKKALKPYIDNTVFLQLLFSDYGFLKPLEIQKLYKGNTGSSIQTKTHTLLNNREELLLYPLLNKMEILEINSIVDLSSALPNYRFMIGNKLEHKALEILDLDKIKFPVYLRTRKTGDRFYPTNSKGSKKLSKFYKDLKLSLYQKQKTKVLVDSTDQVIWVVGFRFDRRFIATHATTNYLNIFIL